MIYVDVIMDQVMVKIASDETLINRYYIKLPI